MRRGIVLGVVLAVGAFCLVAAGFQNPPAGQRGGGAQAPEPLQIQKVKDNLYMITGGGGNTAAFITDDHGGGLAPIPAVDRFSGGGRGSDDRNVCRL